MTKGTWGNLIYSGRRALFVTQLGGGKKHIWIKKSKNVYVTACGTEHDLREYAKLGFCDTVVIDRSPSPQKMKEKDIQYYTNGKIRNPFCEKCKEKEKSENGKNENH